MKLGLLVLCCLSLTAQEWTVRSVQLVPKKGRFGDGAKTKLRIEANSLVGVAGRNQVCDIPLHSITALSRDTQVRNRAATYGDSPGGCAGMDCAADLLILAAFAPFKVRWEYVDIEWRDNGVLHHSMFRFNKADFPAFEKQVTSLTALRFEDLAARRSATRQEIERRKSEAFSLRFDKLIFIRKEGVRHGVYQALILERGPGQGEMYLFAGKRIDPKTPAWVVPVSITATQGGSQAPEVEYGREKRWKSLVAIRLPGRTVRIID